LSSNYGIYNGFELLEHEPIPGREEYINSDKYEIRSRNWNQPGNIKDYLARLNRIRRQNAALQQTAHLEFLQVDNANVIGFMKQSAAADNAIACAIALGAGPQDFWLHFGDQTIGGNPVRAIENLATGEQRLLEWGGTRLRIDPNDDPALLFRCVA
jgi:starch synthase (maltosyl-transferring)